MREEGGESVAPADPYAWTDAHEQLAEDVSADPYAWREAAPAASRAAAPKRSEPATFAEAAPLPAQAEAGDEGGEVYAWVEEPAQSPLEAKPRRRARGRGRGRDAQAEPAANDAVAPASGEFEASPDLSAADPDTGFSAGGIDPAEIFPEAAAAEAVVETTPRNDAASEIAPALNSGAPEPAAAETPVSDAQASGFDSGGLDPVQAFPAPAPEPAEAPAPPAQAAERLAETLDAALGVAPDVDEAEREASAEPPASPAARESDPAEVSGAPVAPRRGWWRLRG